MAKGIKFPASFVAFDRKVIAFDKSGIPWVIDPETGTIAPATIGNEPQSAVGKKKRK